MSVVGVGPGKVSVGRAGGLDQLHAPRSSVGDEIDQSAGQVPTEDCDVRGIGGLGEHVRCQHGQFTNPAHESVGVEAKVPGGGPRVPMGRDSVVAADLHGQPQLLLVDAVRQG